MSEISIYLPGIALAYSAFFLGIASPGPNVLAVIGTSMSVDRKAGVALALGVGTGAFCWALLTTGGLSALLATYAAALSVIKIAGGLYLLWLAFKSLRSAASRHELETTAPPGTRTSLGYYARGLTVCMTNPKAVLVWISIVSLGMHEHAPLWVAVVLVAGLSLLSILIHCVYAVAFSTPVMVRLYSKARRWIQGVLGAFFAFAGLRLLTSRS
jgi:threonine/homoserine/homoserine lactone efflux protein